MLGKATILAGQLGIQDGAGGLEGGSEDGLHGLLGTHETASIDCLGHGWDFGGCPGTTSMAHDSDDYYATLNVPRTVGYSMKSYFMLNIGYGRGD